jgi:hypothetical protein
MVCYTRVNLRTHSAGCMADLYSYASRTLSSKHEVAVFDLKIVLLLYVHGAHINLKLGSSMIGFRVALVAQLSAAAVKFA